MESRNTPTTILEGQLHSIAHDILSAHHGRNFQDSNLFLSNDGGDLWRHQVRVFDMEVGNGISHLQIHQFGDENHMPTDKRLNVLVWKCHMRFLYPMAYTRPTDWRDWPQFVDGVTNRAWALWSDLLAVADTTPQVVNVHPCTTCRKLCRYSQSTVRGDNDELEVDALCAGTTEMQRWGRVNPHTQFSVNDTERQAPWTHPDSNWRSTSSIPCHVDKLFDHAKEDFSAQQVAALSQSGDEIVREQG